MTKKLVLNQREYKTIRAKGSKSANVVMKVVSKNGKKKVRTTFTDPNLKVKYGGRKIKYHDSFDEAKMWLTSWESDQLMEDYGIRNVNTRLSVSQLQQAELAFELLKNTDSIIDAVNFYLANQTYSRLTIKEAFEKWNEVGVKEKNLRPDTIRDRKNTMNKFVDQYGGRDLRFIDKDTVKKFIYKPKIKQVTANGHIRVFKGFFKFCEEEEWIAKSPIAMLKQGKIDQEAPVILKVDQADALIKSAMKLFEGQTLAYFTLLLFTGMRPSEIHDGILHSPNKEDAKPLDWNDFELNGKKPQIIIPKTKIRKIRLLDLEPNCVALLKLARDKPLLPSKGFKRMFSKVYKDAGLVWKEDICRHSWVTYLFVKDEKLAKSALARMAGNTTGILEKAYLNRGVTKSDGIAYFQIGLGVEKRIRGGSGKEYKQILAE